MSKSKIHKFQLSEYENSNNMFYINKVSGTSKAEAEHSHDFFQIYFITRGILKHFIGVFEFTLTRGDMFIIPPNTAHRISRINEMTEFIFVSFSLEFIKKYNIAFINNYLANLSSLSRNLSKHNSKLIIDNKEKVKIENDLNYMVEEFAEKKTGYEEVLYFCLSRILIILERSKNQCTEKNDKSMQSYYKESLLECIDYINRNYTTEITINRLTKKYLLSRTTFYELFRKYTKTSFRDYVNKLRINDSQRLLRDSRYSIEEVGYSVGYKSPSNFYNNFKKYAGTTPGKFRANKTTNE